MMKINHRAVGADQAEDKQLVAKVIGWTLDRTLAIWHGRVYCVNLFDLICEDKRKLGRGSSISANQKYFCEFISPLTLPRETIVGWLLSCEWK